MVDKNKILYIMINFVLWMVGVINEMLLKEYLLINKIFLVYFFFLGMLVILLFVLVYVVVYLKYYRCCGIFMVINKCIIRWIFFVRNGLEFYISDLFLCIILKSNGEILYLEYGENYINYCCCFVFLLNNLG